eukprot:8986757-Pyramimonas_sp.AAC.1
MWFSLQRRAHSSSNLEGLHGLRPVPFQHNMAIALAPRTYSGKLARVYGLKTFIFNMWRSP